MATLVNESMAVTPTTGSDTNASASTGWNAGGWFQLTNDVNQWDQYSYVGDITSNFDMSVDMRMSTTSGADGMWFSWGSSAFPHTEGDSAGIGYMVFRNDFGNSLEIRYAGSTLTSVSYTKDTSFDTLEVIQNGANIVVKYLGSTVINYTDSSYPRSLPGTNYGWGARCGGTGNVHDIKNLLLNTTGVTIPTGNFFSLFKP